MASISSHSSTSTPYCYHVFLSFRGEDVRQTFLSHLYEKLRLWGIRTFKDDNELKRGESISPALLGAIEQSRFAIVVMSENYASSSWCLDELLKITECRKTRGQQVIPVFYNVDPSHVRKQQGKFEEAFAKHKDTIEEDKMQRWKEALREVASISGWDWRNWNNESEFIKSIVRDVSDRLMPLKSSCNDHSLVGMDNHVKELDRLMCLESEDVRMIGLWGMGGIGKTTLAKYVYDRFRRQFEGCYFQDNVKGMFKKHGTLDLQEQFLSKLFRERDFKLWDLGSDVMKERLYCKKVLVVLDDVDKEDQLEIFAKELDWFGKGSRIIITTRDRRLLEYYKFGHIYEVKHLKKTKALQLFSKFAFKQNRPKDDFRELSIQFVNYAGGLPLVLKVLGSMLRGRTNLEWHDMLNKLSKTPNRSILEVLRVSYDGLENDEKDIFLYIACAFNGEYEENVRRILDGCDFYTCIGIKILCEKSLLSISSKQRIWVHDLLQDMARDIIYQECRDEPWKRKILWDNEDIDTVLTECDEMIKVEGIFADMSEAMEIDLGCKAFKRMYNLKLLKICNNYHAGESKVQVSEGLDYMPKKLKYLFWDGFPLKSLPPGFRPENLVEINLPNSSMEKLWEGSQPLRSLKVMNLTNCQKLIEIPDFSKATKLERLRLSNCKSLIEVSSSLKHLDNLIELKLKSCEKLETLPSGIHLRSLRILNLCKCSSLGEFPSISENVERLNLIETAVEEVPPSIEHFSQLVELRLSGCLRLKNLPSTIKKLDSLENLGLSNCPNITEFPEVGKNIKWLYLSGTAIEKVPSWIGERSGLVYLNLSHCQRLANLPGTTQNLTGLKYLYLRGCSNVTESPKISHTLRALDLTDTHVERASLSDDTPRCELPVLERFLFLAARKCSTRRRSQRS